MGSLFGSRLAGSGARGTVLPAEMHPLALLTFLALVALAMELVLDELVLVSRLSVPQMFRSLAGLQSLRFGIFACPASLSCAFLRCSYFVCWSFF